MMTEFPTDVADALAAGIAFFRGANKDTKTAEKAAWNVVGYALGHFTPEQALPVPQHLPAPWTDEDKAAVLEAALNHSKAPQGSQAAPFDWGTLITILLPLIQSVLKKRFGG